jgi:hypothetical protein
MKKLVSLMVLGFQLFTYDALASGIDLTIASDMAAVDLTQVDEARGSAWSLGIARNDDVRATSASLAFSAIGNLNAADSIQAGVGWKASYHNTFQSSYSLAAGVSLRYEPANLNSLGFEGQAYMAPQVLNSNDAERYHELMASVTYDLHSRATVFVGWMNKSLRYQEGAPVREIETADGLMAGFSLVF